MQLDKEAKTWLNGAVERCGKKIEEAETFISIFTKNYVESPETALQLGIAIMLDKPIYVIAFDDQPIPKSLEKVAIGISRVRPDNVEDLSRAIKGMNEALEARGL